MTIIVLSGAVGAGKDTLAALLLDKFEAAGVKSRIRRFAEPIKEACSMLGVDPDNRDTKELMQIYYVNSDRVNMVISEVFDDLDPNVQFEVACDIWQKLVACKRDPGGRGFYFSPRQLQQWIGQGVRDFVPDYYKRRALTDAGEFGGITITPDCRFLNERDIASYHIHIERPSNPLAITTTDISEQHQDKLKAKSDWLVFNPAGGDWLSNLDDVAADIVRHIYVKEGYHVEESGGIGGILQ